MFQGRPCVGCSLPRGYFAANAVIFRFEWDSGITLPAIVLHGSPGLAPQAGHSTCCDFGMTPSCHIPRLPAIGPTSKTEALPQLG